MRPTALTFTAQRSARTLRKRDSQDLSVRLFSGSAAQLALHALAMEPASADELEAIRALIDSKRLPWNRNPPNKENISHETHTRRIAWMLIHFCWQAAAIAGIYRLLIVLLARSASQTRYLIAVAAMLMMVGAAAGTFAWQMRSATPSPTLHNAASTIEVHRCAAAHHGAVSSLSTEVLPARRRPICCDGSTASGCLAW